MHKLIYINHLGEQIVFGEGNILLNKGEEKDYEWDYDTVNGRITHFRHKEKTPPVHIFIYGPDRKAIANRLYEIIERDVLSAENGTLIDGEYSINGYFVGNKKNNYDNGILIELTLQFVSASRWKKETTNVYVTSDSQDEYGLDYEYDYDVDYTLDIDNHILINDNFVESNFIMQISGPCNNPTVVVNDHVYNVNVEVAEGEYLVIDSDEKKIYIVQSNGTKLNVYYARNREHYIFEKIPVGKNSLDYDEDLKFSIKILDERSEPKWI